MVNISSEILVFFNNLRSSLHAINTCHLLCERVLSWLNTVFDTCVHLPISLKPLIPRSPKMVASKLTTQTLAFRWWSRRMCRCHGNMNKYKQAFKIGFVYL